jgi:hypothetical protein
VVPGFHRSLLSTVVLGLLNYRIVQCGKRIQLFKPKALKPVLTGKLVSDRLFVVDTYDSVRRVQQVHENEVHYVSLATLHNRMGHVNVRQLKQLPLSVEGLKLQDCGENEKFECEACMRGKARQKPFPDEGSRAQRVLEKIHMDLMGPIDPPSKGGARYVLTMVDDFSRMAHVEMLKQKGDTYEKVKAVLLQWMRAHASQVRIIQSDGGGEFTSTAFEAMCRAMGIIHQKSCARTPQQNGLAERMNRTLMEMARTTLIASAMQPSWWGEAIKMATYVRNRVCSRVVQPPEKTPYELWCGKKPNIQHMRPFGCYCIAMTKMARAKVDPKADLCRFIGYADTQKGYKVYHIDSKRPIVCRDVEFLENSGRGKFADAENDAHVWSYASLSDDSLYGQEGSNGVRSYRDALLVAPAIARASEPGRRSSKRDEGSDEEASDHESESLEARVSNGPGGDNHGNHAVRESAIRTKPPGEMKFSGIPREMHSTELQASGLSQPLDEQLVEDYVMSTEGVVLLADRTPDGPENDCPTFLAARTGPRWMKWDQAITKEHDSLVRNDVYDVVPRPAHARVIKSAILLKVKRDMNGDISTYKARVIAKGYSQIYGVDYNETFAPVARRESLRLLLAIAAKWEMMVHQMDVNTAFLYADLDEETYMEIPEGLNQGEHGDRVWKLKKCLYGLKQSPRKWNEEMDTTLRRLGFRASRVDPCVYVLQDENAAASVLIALYVDDLIIAAKDAQVLIRIKKALQAKYEMKDLGTAQWCLGMRIVWDENKKWIQLDQKNYIEEVLAKFQMEMAKPIETPMEQNASAWQYPGEHVKSLSQKGLYRTVIGCLNYLATNTRPDIAFATAWLGKFVEEPKEVHWQAVKRILRYLKGTSELGIRYKRGGASPNYLDMCVLSDADWSGDLQSGRSTSGVITMVGGGAVMWTSKRQLSTAQSSAEAEYMALGVAVQDAIWLNEWLSEIGVVLNSAIPLMCDSSSAIAMGKNPIARKGNRHIRVKHHLVRENVENGQVFLKQVKSGEMWADIMTKSSMRVEQFVKCRSVILGHEQIWRSGSVGVKLFTGYRQSAE